jgi:hypothetical protein
VPFALALLAGLFAVNAIPHFVNGVSKRPFPTPFGPSPVVNVVGGWLMFGISGAALTAAGPGQHAYAVAFGAGVGSLAMALFHATVGALGRSE